MITTPNQVRRVGCNCRNTEIRRGKETYKGRLTNTIRSRTNSKGKVVKDWEDMKRYTPSVQMSYIHRGTGLTKLIPILFLN